MTLTRLFISGDLQPGRDLELGPEQAHYLGRVLRLRPGEALHVFNGDCGEFAAVVASLGKDRAKLSVAAKLATGTESALRVHLVQGVSRGDRMDVIVQKATELGVKRITPVLTGFGLVKLAGERAEKRRDHWHKIAISAAEQCGRIRPPLIDVAVPLKSWLGGKPEDADVDLILQPGATTAMTSLHAPATKVCLLVGPEGGFSDAEYEDAALRGFLPVSLGPRVLRTETAAIAAVAVAAALWGDLGPV